MKLPEKAKIASFDVDCQKCFTPLCPNELPVPEGHLIVNALNAQAQFAGYRIGSKDAHNQHAIWVAKTPNEVYTDVEGNNVDIRWPRHAEPGTTGFELLDGLPQVADYDYFVWKGIELDMHPYGACYHDLAENLSTGIIEFLLHNGVEMVLVGGLATDYCVKHTVLQLCTTPLTIIVNLAACRGITLDTTQAAIEAMKAEGAIMIENQQALG